MFTITAFYSEEEGGYMYDIHATSPVDDEPIDGGCCTGSLLDTLEMATAQAKELIKRGVIK